MQRVVLAGLGGVLEILQEVPGPGAVRVGDDEPPTRRNQARKQAFGGFGESRLSSTSGVLPIACTMSP